MFPLNRDMGGILTLSEFITKNEYTYNGFEFLVPFAGSGVADLLATGGVKALINSGAGTGSWGGKTVEEWSAISGVEGFWLFDEPINQGYSDVEIKGWYDAIKLRTSKPVGCIWCASDNLFNNHLDTINYMDFAMVDMYPYHEGDEPGEAEARITWLISKLADITIPVIVIAQGQDLVQYGRDPEEAGVRYQFEAYYDVGYPVCWFSWKDNGETDIKRTYQYLMNEFYSNGGNGEMAHLYLVSLDENTGYIRFGVTQRCWGVVDVNMSGVTEKNFDWFYPIAFKAVSIPVVVAMVNSDQSYNTRYYCIGSLPTPTYCCVSLRAMDGIIHDYTFRVGLSAIGIYR